jgi:hypothetical protein
MMCVGVGVGGGGAWGDIVLQYSLSLHSLFYLFSF